MGYRRTPIFCSLRGTAGPLMPSARVRRGPLLRPDFGGCGNAGGQGCLHQPNALRRRTVVSTMPVTGGTERTTTVIIGTGLSGLAVGAELRRRGVDAIVVDGLDIL